MIRLALLALMATTHFASADIVLAAKTMRAHTLLTESDLKMSDGDLPGTYIAIEDLVGQETRVV